MNVLQINLLKFVNYKKEGLKHIGCCKGTFVELDCFKAISIFQVVFVVFM